MIEKLNYDDFKSDEVFKIENISDVFKKTIINTSDNIERPPLALSIGIDDKSYGGVFYPLKFGSLGNISLIAGQEKSRKSFVKSLLESCTIGGRSNNYTGDIDIIGYIDGKYIISIDSEQSKYDATIAARRIDFMVGQKYNKYIPLMWREKSTLERLQLLEWLFTESEYKDNLGMVVIDGVVDFVQDFNSLSECKDFTEKLMKYSSETNCHIIGVLHLNPGSDKMRGHLGTILGQKAEMVMIVENKGEYSECKCKVVRGSKPFKPFTIRIDDDWMPYISEDKEDFLI